jgi:hypothetical protein
MPGCSHLPHLHAHEKSERRHTVAFRAPFTFSDDRYAGLVLADCPDDPVRITRGAPGADVQLPSSASAGSAEPASLDVVHPSDVASIQDSMSRIVSSENMRCGVISDPRCFLLAAFCCTIRMA